MTHFETLIQQAQKEITEALMKAELGNACIHALMRGRYEGLSLALSIFKKAMRLDAEE